MVDINTYAKFVDTTTSGESRETIYFQDRLAGLDNSHSEIHWSRLMTSSIGMLAESGEFAEVMKKILFQGKEFNEENRFHMKRELGDVLWYVVQCLIALDTTIDEVVSMNVEKLEARYPGGEFDPWYSENREVNDL